MLTVDGLSPTVYISRVDRPEINTTATGSLAKVPPLPGAFTDPAKGISMSNGTTPMPEAGQPVLDAYRVGQTLTVDLAPAEGRKLESTVQVTVRRAGTETVIDLVAEDAIQLAAQLILVAADATKLDQAEVA